MSFRDRPEVRTGLLNFLKYITQVRKVNRNEGRGTRLPTQTKDRNALAAPIIHHTSSIKILTQVMMSRTRAVNSRILTSADALLLGR